MDAKWDVALVKEVTDWIDRATGTAFPGTSKQDIHDTLKNGQTLCKYVLYCVACCVVLCCVVLCVCDTVIKQAYIVRLLVLCR